MGGVNKTTIDGREVDHAPNAKLKEVLNAAGLLPDVNGNIPSDKMPTSSGKTFDGFNVRMPDGTIKYVQINPADGSFVDINDKEIPIPVGTTITSVFLAPGQKLLKYTIIDANGKKCTVPVIVSTSGGTTPTSAKWSEIKAAAISAGVNLGPGPGGSTVTGWKYGSGDYSNGTSINTSSDPAIPENYEIGPVLTAKYTVNGNAVTIPGVTYPNDKKTVREIFTAAGLSTGAGNPGGVPGFNGWTVTLPDGEKIKKPDGTVRIFSESEINSMNNSDTANKIIPPGATITPSASLHRTVILSDGVTPLEMTGFEGGNINTTQIGGFYMADIELTRKQWSAVIARTDTATNTTRNHYSDTRDNAAKTQNFSNATDLTSYDEYPMTFVSLFDAIAFCNWLSIDKGYVPFYYVEKNGSREYNPNNWDSNTSTPAIDYPAPKPNNYDFAASGEWDTIKFDPNGTGFRLPTADEWTFAARGGKDVLFPNFSGDTYNGSTSSYSGDMKAAVDRVASHNQNGNKLRKASESGGDNPIRDMNGNVWEWCNLSKESDWNWKTDKNKYWHARGGGYGAAPTQCTINYDNDGNKPTSCSKDTGFRIIVPLGSL